MLKWASSEEESEVSETYIYTASNYERRKHIVTPKMKSTGTGEYVSDVHCGVWAHTKLAKVQGGPVQTSGTGWRQRANADSAVNVQTPQSILTGRQVSQLHLSTDAEHSR